MIVSPLTDKIDTKSYSKPTQTLSASEHYFVYAIEKRGKKTWFYVIDDGQRDTGWSFIYNADLFRVIDPNIPDGWITTQHKSWFRKVEFTSFPDWANDPSGFYSRLFDAEPNDPERKIIDKYYARYESRITPPQT